MDLGLVGVRALVTAASKGLGRACAQALANEGARVFMCARSEPGLKEATAAVGGIGYFTADVSDEDQIVELVKVAVAELGGLDILVTNAGGPPTGSFEDTQKLDWEIGHQLTVMSAVRLIQQSLPYLKTSGRGRIISLTGYGVKEPIGSLVVSESARAAVTVVAKSLATDLGPFAITVNCIAPGPFLTDRLREIQETEAREGGISLEAQLSGYATGIPMRRVGDPEEVGALCAYLCSSHAGFITGQAITIDGGINRAV